MKSASRTARGDWQTPIELARIVVDLVAEACPAPRTIIEPTCGRGAFLLAAAERFPHAELLGFDLSMPHIEQARRTVPQAKIEHADFFQMDWDGVLDQARPPTLLLGNPPWVTSAALGSVGSSNHPIKRNDKRRPGLAAKTGDANFDISEWMLTRMIDAARSRPFAMAMLCKSSVARKIMEHTARRGLDLDGSVRSIDARRWFDVAVDAVVLDIFVRGSQERPRLPSPWRVFPDLEATAPSRRMGIVDGRPISDLAAFEASRELEGPSEIEWRSGLKHDCAAVMELRAEGGAFENGLGERVELEDAFVFPLRKGSEVAGSRADPARRVLVTQRHLGDDTNNLQREAPKTWAYLARHADRFQARKSSIYRGQPSFAMFGVGAYSFAPWKIAICGLYKRLWFEVLGPADGKPTMLDDTCYFLPCPTQALAEELAKALNDLRAKAFLDARVFWDDKRPIRKALLQSLSLSALIGRPMNAEAKNTARMRQSRPDVRRSAR